MLRTSARDKQTAPAAGVGAAMSGANREEGGAWPNGSGMRSKGLFRTPDTRDAHRAN